MMTPSRQPEARREQILQAAIECFARSGYHQTTMDDIVQASSLSKGALYWYFPSKADLFLAILDTWIAELEEQIQIPEATSASATEQLTAWVTALTRFIQDKADRVRLVLEFWAEVHRSPQIARRLTELYQRRIEALAQVIQRGIERGEIRPTDASSAAQTFLATYDGLLLQQILLPNPLPWEEINQMAVDTLLHGLVGGDSSAVQDDER